MRRNHPRPDTTVRRCSGTATTGPTGSTFPPAPRSRRRRAASASLGLVLAAGGCLFGLTSCTADSPVLAQRVDGKAVILLGYQCSTKSALNELQVGRVSGAKQGPPVWVIATDTPRGVPEVTPGIVPEGYHTTTDDLGGADIGLRVWAQERANDNTYLRGHFDLTKVKDGQVVDATGAVITRADFNKRYHCS